MKEEWKIMLGNDKTRAAKMALQNANKIRGHKSIIIGFPRIKSQQHPHPHSNQHTTLTQ